MQPKRLTELNHSMLKEQIKPGDILIDTTAGNGHDTCFLAEQTERTGLVLAYDIQEAAIHNTKTKLEEKNLNSRVQLFNKCHSHIEEDLKEYENKISLAVFNLGYLPGSDKSIITKTKTTLSAIKACLKLLKEDGILSIMLYPGHPGGKEEAEAVLDFCGTMGLEIEKYCSQDISDSAPQLLIVKKSKV